MLHKELVKTILENLDFINYSSTFVRDLLKNFGDTSFLSMFAFHLYYKLTKPKKLLLKKLYKHFEIPKFYQDFENKEGNILQHEYFLSTNVKSFIMILNLR